MARDRRSVSLLELTLLGAVAAEAIVNRLLTQGLEPHPAVGHTIAPSAWLVALRSVSLFLLYFAAMVGVAALLVRVAELVRRPLATLGERIDAYAGAVTLALVAGAATFAAIVSPEPVHAARTPAEGLLHFALAAVAAHQIARVWARRAPLGAAIGVTICALPILLYGAASLLSHTLWSEDELLGGPVKEHLAMWARGSLALAAIASPYCLSPRPFSRHATRLFPFIIAVGIATIGAWLLRSDYVGTVRAANRVFGLDLRTDVAQDQLALYLLALATVVWTIVSCLIADAPGRRRIGAGLALLVLVGAGFSWPLAFVAGAAGLLMLADGALAVGEQEDTMFVAATPPIDDEAWQAFVGQVVSSLRRGGDASVSAVSVRGEGQTSSTVIVTERRGVPVRVRVERVGRAVVVLDLVCGRDVDLARAATWSVLARGGRGSHPEPPAAGSAFRTDDLAFDERFRARGDRTSLLRLLDERLRAQAAATLDGWVAYWEGEGLRHRVYPGVGAPLDQPLPLSDLAVRRSASPAAAERVVALIELCCELASRGLPANDQPAALRTPPADDAGVLEP